MEAVIGVIRLDVYSLDVGVFRSYSDRMDFLANEGVVDPAHLNESGLAGAALDSTEAGDPRLSIVITPRASVGTCAHECSHIADFACDVLGLPISVEATEVRAYLIGYMMDMLSELGALPE